MMARSEHIRSEFSFDCAPDKDHAVGEYFSLPVTFTAADLRVVLLLVLWSLCLNAVSLGELEFLRHTEADRTLIAWEMLEEGEFLVPQLLGSVILTKPPLFYWSMIAAMKICGGVEEWVARLPSVIAALIFVVSQYLCFRLLGAKRILACFAAIVLSTGFSFFGFARLAEIDMLYGLFSGLALYGGYFAVISQRLPATVFAYLMLTLGFLTKGPPIVFFFFPSIVLFGLWYSRHSLVTKKSFSFAQLLRFQCSGLAVFLTIVGIWLYFLASRVGLSAIAEQFSREVLHRIFEPSRHERGSLFYVWNLLGSLLPWTPLFICGVIDQLLQWRKRETHWPRQYWEFLVFNAIALSCALLILSVAEGKSNRYLFPVYACAVNLTVLTIIELSNRALQQWLFRLGLAAAPVLLGAVVAAPFLVPASVTKNDLVLACLSLMLPAVMLFVSCVRRKGSYALAAMALLMVAARFVEIELYIPSRNAEHSVKAVAASIARVLPRGAPCYTVELYERWLNYYLKRLERYSYRLTPERVAQMKGTNMRVYLLLSGEDETWRLEQLYYYDKTLKLIRLYQAGKHSFLLVEANSATLYFLAPRHTFPSFPSPRYYAEAPER